jgi:endonuclease G
MKNIWILISVISTVIVGVSCQNDDVKPAADFSLSIKALQSDASLGSSFLDIRCGGEWTLSLEFQENVNPWATLSTTSGVGNKKNAYLSWETNMTSVSRFVKIVLTSGNETAECLFTQSAKDAEPVVKPDVNVDVTKVNWMELPAMDDPSLEYYCHTFKMGGVEYRNYSIGYSRKDFLSMWVAYPLCDLYTNGSASGGGDDWEPNPWFSEDFQPIFYNSFGYSQGYERGHQIANADRKCCSEANKQTFYFTNATLQHMNFNGHVWANLEGNMRTTAKSADTLYVVTGCVMSASPRYINDSRGHRVPVPSGYFKAALRYQKSLASQQQEWMGAAFYLDHDASKYPSKQITASEAMSIDELEKKLGMDFFVNLPAMVGADKAAAIEVQNPDNYKFMWGIQ